MRSLVCDRDNVLFFDAGVDRRQAGEYTCVAENRHGRVEARTSIDVHCEQKYVSLSHKNDHRRRTISTLSSMQQYVHYIAFLFDSLKCHPRPPVSGKIRGVVSLVCALLCTLLLLHSLRKGQKKESSFLHRGLAYLFTGTLEKFCKHDQFASLNGWRRQFFLQAAPLYSALLIT